MNPLGFLQKNGPLATGIRICRYIQTHSGKLTGFSKLASLINNTIVVFQHYLDGRFDRINHTNTSGVIAIKDLTISSNNTELAIWYEPMSVKIFHQIIRNLKINYSDFAFIDLGSGKGRVLLMAALYKFKRIIGVEFAEELHRVALINVDKFNETTNNSILIEAICEDATNYVFPNDPLVIFFYSPFKGNVMKQVLDNITRSFNNYPRRIILIFYGENKESIELLYSTKFQAEKLKLKPDWSRIKNYMGFVFTSPGV